MNGFAFRLVLIQRGKQLGNGLFVSCLCVICPRSLTFLSLLPFDKNKIMRKKVTIYKASF